MSDTGRLTPDIPRWTTFDSEGRRNHKASVQAGLRNGMGTSKAWCYRCRSEHPWVEPCHPVKDEEPEPEGVQMDTCTYCGVVFPHSPLARSVNRYCSPQCHLQVRKARSRLGYDGRYDQARVA